MFKPYEVFIGLRYTRAKRRNHFISFISLVSMAGIALGVMALITVISVMNGFEQELRSRILGMVAHVTVSGDGGALRDWPAVQQAVAGEPEVLASAPYVETEAMISFAGNARGVLVRGIDPAQEPQVAELTLNTTGTTLGALAPGEFGIILGADLGRALGARAGDKVTVLIPEASATPAGVLPRMKRFTVLGYFSAGMYEYDSALALVALGDAQRLIRLGDAVSGVRLRLDDLMRAPLVAQRLAQDLPYLGVSDWTRQHVNFFRAVRTEKTVMFIILSLIVGVAAFNIISTLVMMVADKRADIAILRTMGATPASVMGVFVVQGAVIGVVGTLLGVIGGVALSLNVETLVPWLERTLHVSLWPSDVYYISSLPSQLNSRDVANITGLALSLSLLATLYPAWRAARTDPAEALRYE
ncbi:lipoprotein-releasing ABC transporter permease subunit [Immundisolibacter sp.]|uniref:lipoprotein-releasing ABC transporter permease subunit n=1 Tax=Immundisolibacter sp. TaxID=1934948 RepID=UPI000EEA3B1F|nr:lipoprotein-releasing ABC transporter permease subunit [Gammaproteobacteria bacterium]